MLSLASATIKKKKKKKQRQRICLFSVPNSNKKSGETNREIRELTAVINHTRPSADKRLDKTYVLVYVNHLRLLADLPEKRVQSETLQRPTRKNYNFTFAMYGQLTKYIGIKYSLKENEDVFRVFQRPFVCMNAPEINQTARE